MIKTDILYLNYEFPVISSDKEPGGSFLFELARAVSEEAGIRIRVLAFRFGNQPSFEEKNGISVERIEFPRTTHQVGDACVPTWEALDTPEKYDIALSVFAEHAMRLAASIGHIVPVWCHGFMAASAAMKLRKRGYPVVGVSLGLVAEELMLRMELPDDPLRRRNFPRTISSIVGALCGKRLRASFVRLLTRNAAIISRLPLPPALELLHNLEIEAQFFNAAHIIVAVSPGHADSVARYHPHANDKLRYCVGESPSPSHGSYWPFPLRDDRFRLVMVGRPCPQKGWDYAAAALRNIESGYPGEAQRLEFVSIGGLAKYGSAYSDQALQGFNKLKKVAYADLGHIPHEDVMRVMSAADALLLPSVYEPFGLVLLEAMVNGCMVLSSDADGPRDVVKPPWGILMGFQDPGMRVSEIERGILRLLSLSREELRRHGGEARAAAGKYSWQECARVNIEALDEARMIVLRNGDV